MDNKRIARELVKVAKQINAGDEWTDEKTYAFVKELEKVMKRDKSVEWAKAKGNVVRFGLVIGLNVVPLVLTVYEFGYASETSLDSVSLNGTITSDEHPSVIIPGGYTEDRNPDELWERGKEFFKKMVKKSLQSL